MGWTRLRWIWLWQVRLIEVMSTYVTLLINNNSVQLIIYLFTYLFSVFWDEMLSCLIHGITSQNALNFKVTKLRAKNVIKEIFRVTISWNKYVASILILQEKILIILYKQMKDTSLLYQIVSCSSVSRYNIEHIYYLKNHFIIFLFGCNKKKLYYGCGNYTVLRGCVSYTERYIATILAPF